MVPEKEKTLIDFIKLVSPGTAIRNVIDDLLRSGLGGMIVFDKPELYSQNIAEGGFRINSRFTPQKLFELCKMDAAVIISPNLKRIVQANVTMNPDPSIHTTETGTRHKSAERTAKQANTFVIAISERRKKTTLYYSSSRYYLKSTDELIRNISSTLQLLEKQRELLNENISNLNLLEMSELVSISDVCQVIQRTEMIQKISNSVKRNFTELGKEGSIMHMRYRELLKNVEKTENDILRDYSTLPLKRSKTLVSNLTFDGLQDLDSIARLIIDKNPEETISPKGFRFLSHLTLSEKEISQIIKQYKNIENIIKLNPTDLETTLKNRANTICEEIRNLREQVLSGKIIC